MICTFKGHKYTKQYGFKILLICTGAPDRSHEMCAYMMKRRNGDWVDNVCERAFGVICKKAGNRL